MITNKYFDPLYFILAFAIGFFYNYLIKPESSIVIKYPTPYTNYIYKDDSNACYKYNLTETPCPSSQNDPNLFKMPIQTL
jgi:hypothetical protein